MRYVTHATSFPLCHNTSEPVIIHEEPRIIAGGSECKAPSGGIIFDLADRYVPTLKLVGIEIPEIVQPKIISAFWRDFGDCQITKDEWSYIARALWTNPPAFITCQGGHGRTGTALAILGHFWGIIPESEDVVKWVRDHYCVEAVESAGQVHYIEEMTGRAVTEVGSSTVSATISTKQSLNYLETCQATNMDDLEGCGWKILGHFCVLIPGHAMPHHCNRCDFVWTPSPKLAGDVPWKHPAACMCRDCIVWVRKSDTEESAVCEATLTVDIPVPGCDSVEQCDGEHVCLLASQHVGRHKCFMCQLEWGRA